MFCYIIKQIKYIFRLIVPFKVIKVINVNTNTNTRDTLNNGVNVNKKLISNYHEDCSYNNLQKLNKLRQRN